MTIAEVREKCKSALTCIPRDVLVVGVLFFVSLASFGLGFLAGRDSREGSGQAYADSITEATTSTPVTTSKAGTKYYFPQCTGANRISEENRIWFASHMLAERAGYTRAKNCVSH
jgi:hypothetical protein